MNNEIKIRKSTSSDNESIIKLLTQIAALHRKGRSDIFKQTESKFTKKELDEIISSDDKIIFVAEMQGEIVGYCFCFYKKVSNHQLFEDRKYLYIDDLCVDQNKRGYGIGRIILDYVVDYAKSEMFDSIELNVWEFNENAVKFYEKYGFGTQKRQMELKL